MRTYRDEFQTWTPGRGGATKSCDVTWRRRSTFTLSAFYLTDVVRMELEM